MSADESPTLQAQPDKDPVPPTVVHSQKSYRRKYRKIMVRFERQMRESTTLFKDQQRIEDISQRIAEQNDQILNLLLELNSLPQVPARMRFDLGDAKSKDTETHTDEQEAMESLRLARHAIQKGDKKQSEYVDMELSLLDTVEFAPKRKYIDLVKGGALKIESNEAVEVNGTGGFLSSKQEEDYKISLDDFMDQKTTNPRKHVLGGLGHRSAEKSIEREREAQLRNPVSVYNWLRKNQPQVFLQDADNDKVKGSRISKRAANKAAKADPDMYDEDGFALETSAGRGKRKRDEDGGYRPKGGHARPTKRRKEESSGGKRSKRTSMDMSNS